MNNEHAHTSFYKDDLMYPTSQATKTLAPPDMGLKCTLIRFRANPGTPRTHVKHVLLLPLRESIVDERLHKRGLALLHRIVE